MTGKEPRVHSVRFPCRFHVLCAKDATTKRFGYLWLLRDVLWFGSFSKSLDSGSAFGLHQISNHMAVGQNQWYHLGG